MRSIPSLLLALCVVLPMAARAQYPTNAPATEIENFELQPDTVIVKGYGEVGSITTESGILSVRCKESDNPLTGGKMFGIAVVFTSNQSRSALVVDYDELDSLIHGLDYLSKISYNVATMPSFDAGITTRSGLRISAHSERRQGGIQMFIQFNSGWRIPLASDQFAQFQSLVSESKTSLDADKNKNQGS